MAAGLNEKWRQFTGQTQLNWIFLTAEPLATKNSLFLLQFSSEREKQKIIFEGSKRRNNIWKFFTFFFQFLRILGLYEDAKMNGFVNTRDVTEKKSFQYLS